MVIENGVKSILIVANSSWYIYNFRKETIQSFIDSGYKVVAAAPFDKNTDKLINLGVVFKGFYVDKGGINPLKDLKTFFSALILLRNTKPSVVLNFTPKCNIYVSLAAKLCRTPSINNISGMGLMKSRKGLLKIVIRFLYKLASKGSSFTFVQNEEDKQFFLHEIGIKPDKISRLLGSGVNLSRFSFSVRQGNVTRFCFVGRLLKSKGILHFLEAARIVKSQLGSSVEFMVIGGTVPYSSDSVPDSVFEEYGDVAKFFGNVDSVEPILKTVDCVVLPSFYGEGVPKSLLEAAAMGKAIITSNTSGCRDTINQRSGFLLDNPDSEELARLMLQFDALTADEKLAMFKAAREKAELEFSVENNINEYKRVIESVSDIAFT